MSGPYHSVYLLPKPIPWPSRYTYFVMSLPVLRVPICTASSYLPCTIPRAYWLRCFRRCLRNSKNSWFRCEIQYHPQCLVVRSTQLAIPGRGSTGGKAVFVHPFLLSIPTQPFKNLKGENCFVLRHLSPTSPSKQSF